MSQANLLRVPDGVAAYFGDNWKPSNSTQRRWINSGKLPAVKLGRQTLVRQEDLESFLSSLPAYESHAGTDYVEPPTFGGAK